MVDFTVAGQRVALDRASVERKLRGVEPERIQLLAVEVNRISYPVKQALYVATGIDRAEFGSHQARHIFKQLGFPVMRGKA
jgi:hypothetical protein